MSLPKDFLDKMQTLLKEEYEAFINSYEQEKSLGLRVNTLKTTLDQFETLNKFKNDLGTTAGTVSVDPLNYASKTMITYKKPGHKNFSCPYLTSVYSGMMLDRYC